MVQKTGKQRGGGERTGKTCRMASSLEICLVTGAAALGGVKRALYQYIFIHINKVQLRSSGFQTSTKSRSEEAGRGSGLLFQERDVRHLVDAVLVDEAGVERRQVQDEAFLDLHKERGRLSFSNRAVKSLAHAPPHTHTDSKKK